MGGRRGRKWHVLFLLPGYCFVDFGGHCDGCVGGSWREIAEGWRGAMEMLVELGIWMWIWSYAYVVGGDVGSSGVVQCVDAKPVRAPTLPYM